MERRAGIERQITSRNIPFTLSSPQGAREPGIGIYPDYFIRTGIGLPFENRREARKLGLLPQGKSFEFEWEHRTVRTADKKGWLHRAYARGGGDASPCNCSRWSLRERVFKG